MKTLSKDFTKEPLHRLSAVPLVLSGPLCPLGISPPRGESPLSGEAVCKLANAVFKKLDRLHQKTPEYQHYRYRQRQPPALASPRRTARYERISPDGFDMTALEVALRGRIPPPPSGGPPRTERFPLPCGHLPTPWGVTLFKGGLYTAYKRRI